MRSLEWELAALDETPVRQAEEDAQRHEFLAMQPRLDGSGGRLHGELGLLSWAVVDAALDLVGTDRGEHGESSPPVPRPPHTPRTTASRRLDRLVRILDEQLAREQQGRGRSAGSDGPGGGDGTSRPGLLLRVDLASLLDRERLPADLLTRLTGGHVRITSESARRLIDARGADLRAVVVDDRGSVLGVGRRTRIPPGWLRDTALVPPAPRRAARRHGRQQPRPGVCPPQPAEGAGRVDCDAARTAAANGITSAAG